MSILRTRRPANYRQLLVRPIGDFNPRNWRECPKRFEVIRRICTTDRRGKIDAESFLHNRAAIADQTAAAGWYVVMS